MRDYLSTHGPRVMPPLSSILDDLGRPTADQVARFLMVHKRTVRRWIEKDQAPRACMVALFWLTRWGRSQVECQAVNDAQLAYAQAAAHASESAARLAQVERLLALGDFGAANAPMHGQG